MTNLTFLVSSLQSVSKSINFYGSIFILIPGFFMNTFCFFFFLRKKFWSRNLKMGFFYSLDCLFCQWGVIVCLLIFFPATLGFDITTKSNTWCRLLFLARYQCLQVNAYFYVLATLERTISVLNRRAISIFAKYRYLTVLVICIWIVVALLNGINWWRYVSVSSKVVGNVTTYTYACTGARVVLIETSFAIVLSRFLPPAANLTMNTMIIIALVKSKKRVGNKGNKSLSRKEYYFALSLLANNFIFIVLTFPSAILVVFSVCNYFVPTSPDWINFITVLFNISTWGNFIYISLPFFNNLAFNKIFRSELLNSMSSGAPRVIGSTSTFTN